jgi:hypothetical protein
LSVGYQSARHGLGDAVSDYALPSADTNAYMRSALWGAGGLNEFITPQAHRMSESLKNEVPKKRPPFLAGISRPLCAQNGIKQTRLSRRSLDGTGRNHRPSKDNL